MAESRLNANVLAANAGVESSCQEAAEDRAAQQDDEQSQDLFPSAAAEHCIWLMFRCRRHIVITTATRVLYIIDLALVTLLIIYLECNYCTHCYYYYL